MKFTSHTQLCHLLSAEYPEILEDLMFENSFVRFVEIDEGYIRFETEEEYETWLTNLTT